jgi:NAD(P)-dependent dehydrogenase (short-subunit alcohol dehydrogenase family)
MCWFEGSSSPPAAWRGGGTVYGMAKAALERFTTGLAAESWESNIAVNSLSPNRVVATSGAVCLHLVPAGDRDQTPSRQR